MYEGLIIVVLDELAVVSSIETAQLLKSLPFFPHDANNQWCHSLILYISTATILQLSPNNLVQILCKVSQVLPVQPRHADPSVCSHIDMCLLHKRLALLWSDSGETGFLSTPSTPAHSVPHSPKHPDLVDNVIPVARCLEFFCQHLVQLLPHVNNTPRHGRNVPFPLFKQLCVVQNEVYLTGIFWARRFCNLECSHLLSAHHKWEDCWSHSVARPTAGSWRALLLLC